KWPDSRGLIMHDLRTLILAAGKGTRMKSRKAKVLHKVGGGALIEHVLRAAESLSPEVYVVVGHQSDKVRELIPEAKCGQQRERLGTGHAVISAKEQFAGYSGDILVLPGDVPLIRAETLKAFVEFHQSGGYVASIMTADVPNPAGYGRIVRRGG